MGTAAASAGSALTPQDLSLDLPRDYGPDGAAGGLSRSTPRQANDASVRRPGLGARLLAMSDNARAGYDLQFRQRFFLSDSQRRSRFGLEEYEPPELLS